MFGIVRLGSRRERRDGAFGQVTRSVFAVPPITTALQATNRVIAHGLSISSHQVVVAVTVVVVVLALRARALLGTRRGR